MVHNQLALWAFYDGQLGDAVEAATAAHYVWVRAPPCSNLMGGMASLVACPPMELLSLACDLVLFNNAPRSRGRISH